MNMRASIATIAVCLLLATNGAVLLAQEPQSARDSAVDTLVAALREREKVLETVRTESVRLTRSGSDERWSVETLSLEKNGAREHWVRRSCDNMPKAELDAAMGAANGFPDTFWRTLEKRASPHFDIYDGADTLSVGADHPRGLWSGHQLAELDTFIRRGALHCGFLDAETWLSERVKQWRFIGTVDNGDLRLWTFTTAECIGAVTVQRIWTSCDAELRFIGLSTSRAKEIDLLQVAKKWVDVEAGRGEQEMPERTRVVTHWDSVEGKSLSSKATFGQGVHGVRNTTVWIRYVPKPDAPTDVARYYASDLPPWEIRDSAFVLHDRRSSERKTFRTFGPVDAVAPRLRAMLSSSYSK